MILDELKTLDTRPESLRRFGLVVGAVFTVVALLLAWSGVDGTYPERFAGLPERIRELPALTSLLIAGLALIVFGILVPASLRRPYLAWMGLALALGFVMTRVILGVVFYLVITPIGLVRRALGHDSMHRKPDASVSSYWIRKEPPADPRASLEKYW